MLSIKNQTRVMVQYNLPHEECCSGAVCLCTKKETLVWVRNKEGGLGQMFRQQRLCRSIILTGGETSGPLPDAAAFSPEIKAAAARRDITITPL